MQIYPYCFSCRQLVGHFRSFVLEKHLQAYTWVGIYLLLIVYNMVYGKSVTSKVSFASPVWGLTPWIIRARIDGSLGRGWGDGWGTETGNIRPYAILMGS